MIWDCRLSLNKEAYSFKYTSLYLNDYILAKINYEKKILRYTNSNLLPKKHSSKVVGIKLFS